MLDDFVVALASGKGGTGKTTVAVNLAQAACELGHKVQYLDCDVEEPNGHLFLRPKISATRQVTIDVPKVDLEKCTACGQCGQICQFGAIISIKENVLTFEQLCHSCGGCFRVCPDDALKQKPLEIGTIESGKAGEIASVAAKLRELEARLKQLPPEPEIEEVSIEWHPKAADLYRRKVANLQEALNADDLTRDEATTVLRGLIDKIVVYPAEKRGLFDLQLHGHLAAILNMGKHDNVGGGVRLMRTSLRIPHLLGT